MKRILSTTLFSILLSYIAFSQTGSNTATIVIHIDDLTSTESNKIIDKLNADKTINLEYQCTESGVMVFKLNRTSMSEIADVKIHFQRELAKIISSSRLEILHIDLQLNHVSSKC